MQQGGAATWIMVQASVRVTDPESRYLGLSILSAFLKVEMALSKLPRIKWEMSVGPSHQVMCTFPGNPADTCQAVPTMATSLGAEKRTEKRLVWR